MTVYVDFNKTANANNMDIATLVSEQEPMADQKIKVLNFEMRVDPDVTPFDYYTDGYSYTVEITSPEGKKTVREIFMGGDVRNGLNFDDLKYVHTDAAGDKFYDPMSPPKFTDEVVSEEIREALKVASKLKPTELKDRDLGPAARARLAARVGTKAQHAPKPN